MNCDGSMQKSNWKEFPANIPKFRLGDDFGKISVECVVYTPADGFDPFKVAQLLYSADTEEYSWNDIDDAVTHFMELHVP